MKPTIRDVARAAGVSVSTVSRHLNGNRGVNPISVAKIEKAIKECGYTPNAAARSLKSNKTYTIGLIVSDIANPFFMHAAKSIEDVISQYNYNLIICGSNEDWEKELKCLRMLREKCVDGIIISPTGKSGSLLTDLNQSGMPVVVIDREYDIKDADMIIEDNRASGCQLAEVLIKNGHRRIAVLKGSSNSITSKQRFEGVCSAVRQYGLDPDQVLITENCNDEAGACLSSERIFSMEPKPTALIALNPRLVNGFIMYANKNRIRIPRDVSLTGIVLKQNNVIYPNPITCIEQTPDELGYKAGELIIKRLSLKGKNPPAPARYVFEKKLTIGETVAKVRSKSDSKDE